MSAPPPNFAPAGGIAGPCGRVIENNNSTDVKRKKRHYRAEGTCSYDGPATANRLRASM